MSKKNVFGLGTGRCGTQSLAFLLKAQRNAGFSHEVGGLPFLPWVHDDDMFQRYYNIINNRVGEIVGDVSFYCLPYWESILDMNDKTKFIILQRDRESTIRSYEAKTNGYNAFSIHNGGTYKKSSWDKCFPKFSAPSKKEAIGKYYDHYYEECKRIPEEKRFWLKTEELNSEERVLEMLRWCGFFEPKFIMMHKNRILS